MKAKIYLTHNCDAHKKELGYKEDDPCCDKEEDVGDFEMELVDNSQNRIEFNVLMEHISEQTYGLLTSDFVRVLHFLDCLNSVL